MKIFIYVLYIYMNSDTMERYIILWKQNFFTPYFFIKMCYRSQERLETSKFSPFFTGFCDVGGCRCLLKLILGQKNWSKLREPAKRHC